MSNDLGQREVCAVTALGQIWTTSQLTELDEIKKIDETREKESEDMKIMV